MTNGERNALVEELLAAAVPATVAITDKAAACIHTDGQQIAELEAALRKIDSMNDHPGWFRTELDAVLMRALGNIHDQ